MPADQVEREGTLVLYSSSSSRHRRTAAPTPGGLTGEVMLPINVDDVERATLPEQPLQTQTFHCHPSPGPWR